MAKKVTDETAQDQDEITALNLAIEHLGVNDPLFLRSNTHSNDEIISRALELGCKMIDDRPGVT